MRRRKEVKSVAEAWHFAVQTAEIYKNFTLVQYACTVLYICSVRAESLNHLKQFSRNDKASKRIQLVRA